MSEQTPPPEGQIHTPNPLEIFWETNRRGIIVSVVILVLIIVGRWGFEEYNRAKRNATWGEFAQKTGLGQIFAPEDAVLPAETLAAYQNFKLDPKMKANLIGGLIQGVIKHQWDRVKGQLTSNLTQLSEADIQEVMTTYAGSPAGWWAEWILACKYRALGNTAKVEATLASLKQKAPDFEAFYKTAYPPVYVPEPDEKEGDDEKKNRSDEKILQAEDDSLADVLIRTTKTEEAFQKSHPDLYKPVEPEGKTVIFETNQGNIEVRLYEKASPKTCARFLKNVEEGIYKDLYFHEIWKKIDSTSKANPLQPESSVAKLAFFGNPNAKGEDRTKWTEFKSEKTITFEANTLSHFPYMLCAVRQDDRRDCDTQQVYFTGSDCAESRDGDYVIFGRVISDEGKALVDKIVSGPLESTKEEEAGKGKPSEPILVKSVILKK